MAVKEKKHMMTNGKIGAALVGGYVLGRTKKAKLAIALGMALAGKKLSVDPQQLVRMAANSPAFSALNKQVREELLDTTRSAATSALTSRANRLADSLQGRSADLEDDDRDGDDADRDGDAAASADGRDADRDGDGESGGERKGSGSGGGERRTKAASAQPRKAASGARKKAASGGGAAKSGARTAGSGARTAKSGAAKTASSGNRGGRK
ncbi:hypothetical protein [Streptomyces sp. NPDC054784]